MKSFLLKTTKLVTCCPRTRITETPVKASLSYSPAQMFRAAQSGLAISSRVTALQSSQGVPNPSWDLPLERLRGTDIADIYELQENSRIKIRSAGIQAKKKVKQSNNNES